VDAHVTGRRLAALLGDWEVGGATYRALADRIRLLVMDGRLPVGTRLPSERDLATVLGRSRSTIIAAYAVLRERGYATSRRGSGTVTALPATARPSTVDFAHALPPPVEGVAEAMSRALSHVDRAVAGPGFDMVGDPVLRARIADRYTARGVPTTADQVMVTLGGQHAIGLLSRTLVRPGDRVLVESPSYPHAYEALLEAGAQLVTTPVTMQGWDSEHLLATLERTRPALAYLVPDFQNPTGASMPPALRSRLAAAARAVGTMLVIDETTADLSIDRSWDDGPFARYGEVVTIGSLSKSLWSGLRIGWIRAQRPVIAALARLRPARDLGTPRLEQLVAAELLPVMPSLLAVRSAQLRAGRDHLRAAVRSRLPEWHAPTVDGGLSLWVGLGRPVSSSVVLLSRAKGLAISAGPRFTVDGSHERFLRLPFTASETELDRGVEILADVWSALADLGTDLDAVASVA
jgi:DNA-binding transcriptional MocR family regulator